jgi:hypothetical protein
LIASSRGGKLAAELLERGALTRGSVIAISALATTQMIAAAAAQTDVKLLMLHGAFDRTNTIDRVRLDVMNVTKGGANNIKLVVFPNDGHSLHTCAEVLGAFCLGLAGVAPSTQRAVPSFESLPRVTVYTGDGTFAAEHAPVASAAPAASACGFAGGYCIKCEKACAPSTTHKCACGHYPSQHRPLEPDGSD